MADIAALEARLTELEAERAIRRTLYRYGHAIGLGDEAGWLDGFTEDAVFDVRRRDMTPGGSAPNALATHPHPEMRGTGRVSVVFRGRAELARFIAGHPRPPARYHKHIVVDPLITVEGATARVESYFMRLDAGPDGVPHLTAFGRYLDRLVRGEDGRWRFAERVAEVESRGPDPF